MKEYLQMFQKECEIDRQTHVCAVKLMFMQSINRHEQTVNDKGSRESGPSS